MIDPKSTDEIEFLNVTEPLSITTEVVTTTQPRGNGLAIAAALAISAFGIAALATSGSGSDEAAPPTTPPPTAPAPPSTAVTSLGLDTHTATIGEGPTLEWSRVDAEIDATAFAWVDAAFFGSGGTVDVVIDPMLGRLDNVVLLGPAEATNRSVRSTTVAVSPTDEPWRLIFPSTDPANSVTIAPSDAASSDLVTASTITAAERQGDLVLVLQTTATSLDVELFRDRVGTDMDPIFGVSLQQGLLTISGNGRDELIPVDELDLSPDDLSALQTLGQPMQTLSVGTIGGETQPVASPMNRIDWIAVVGDEFVAGGDQLWRSIDGIEWEQSSGDTPRFGGLNAPGPDGVLSGLAFEGDAGFLTMSTDSGRSWNRLARPFENTWTIDSAFPIVAMTGWQDEPFVPQTAGWTVLGPRFELRIDGEDDTFELLDRDGTTILSGIASDPSSGFRFVPGSTDVWFVDPVSGAEIARFPQSAFASAFAAARTLDGQPQLVAFANVMDGRNGNLEWSLTRVPELFGPDALAVDITPGEGWFLADVTTITGRDLYLAEMPAAVVGPPSN